MVSCTAPQKASKAGCLFVTAFCTCKSNAFLLHTIATGCKGGAEQRATSPEQQMPGQHRQPQNLSGSLQQSWSVVSTAGLAPWPAAQGPMLAQQESLQPAVPSIRHLCSWLDWNHSKPHCLYLFGCRMQPLNPAYMASNAAALAQGQVAIMSQLMLRVPQAAGWHNRQHRSACLKVGSSWRISQKISRNELSA